MSSSVSATPPAGAQDPSRERAAALRSYLHLGNYRIKGWIEPAILWVCRDLAREQERRGVSGSIVEIGVHHGRFFVGLCLTAAVEHEAALAIDLFGRQDLNIDKSGKGDEAVFRRNLGRFGLQDDTQVLAADSTTLAANDVTKRVGPVRVFSVDGGHTAGIVEHDTTLAAETLAPGGIVIGDDVFNASWPGVVEGTLAFLDSHPAFVPFGIAFNKVLICDVEHADAYREALLGLARRRFWISKVTEFRGHPVVQLAIRPWDFRARLAGKRLLGRD